MRIALLNLQYDTNYGGHLQRYALMTVLQKMGHDVTHLNLRFNFDSAPFYRKVLRAGKRCLKNCLSNQKTDVFLEYHAQKRYEKSCALTDPFYNRYIKHTQLINSKKGLSCQTGYDAYLVGSDQVWRKTIADFYGIETYFFDFIPDSNKVKRVAYGASLGVAENELQEEDIKRLTPLYKRFSNVSVRENSGLALLKQYGWDQPQPSLVLDPTLLLTSDDYLELINDGTTTPSEGNMFCYILDPTDEKEEIIRSFERAKGLKPFYASDDNSHKPPIQQWIRSFYDSEFIVTDSFHGMVFSIIFNKPFKLIYNPFRGNARFDSLMKLLQIPNQTELIDWNVVNNNLQQKRKESIQFLQEAFQN